jgi:hypothetical protein
VLIILFYFYRFKYAVVFLTGFYYSYTFAISSILPAVTSANLFKRLYNFTPSQTGLALGVGTLVGSTLGELLGGVVVDRSMRYSREKSGGKVRPEVRLQGIWLGMILVPVSIYTFFFLLLFFSFGSPTLLSIRVSFSAEFRLIIYLPLFS